MRPFLLPQAAQQIKISLDACATGLLFSDALIESLIGRTTRSNAIATTTVS